MCPRPHLSTTAPYSHTTLSKSPSPWSLHIFVLIASPYRSQHHSATVLLPLSFVTLVVAPLVAPLGFPWILQTNIPNSYERKILPVSSLENTHSQLPTDLDSRSLRYVIPIRQHALLIHYAHYFQLSTVAESTKLGLAAMQDGVTLPNNIRKRNMGWVQSKSISSLSTGHHSGR
ncbi:hypothetical protein JAAARDRAFT_661968 [Jaapia argillacea MUCL 33604]|uniref:Uncharacterized protein n=1 Tax=Jaapia argillacea MUCL 33604 TaxID=933084 RepID=A0A067P3D2_9AGAM|nr:hypothetical protein JAAARDRAFT_661968 [Jaapia argillacea MUCL 33604]